MSSESLYRTTSRTHVYGKVVLLNKPTHHSDACASYRLELPMARAIKDDALDEQQYTNGHFKIRDCNSQAHLSLDFHTHEEFENSKAKLGTLADLAMRALDALEVARERWVLEQKQLHERKRAKQESHPHAQD